MESGGHHFGFASKEQENLLHFWVFGNVPLDFIDESLSKGPKVCIKLPHPEDDCRLVMFKGPVLDLPRSWDQVIGNNECFTLTKEQLANYGKQPQKISFEITFEISIFQ